MSQRILFIGGGHMSTSLIGGLRQAGWPGSAIAVVDRNADKREHLHTEFGVQTHADVAAAELAVDALVLSVKPQVMAEAARALAPRLGQARPLVLSVAAGVPLAALRKWLGSGLPYVRCMPNMASLLGAGATGMYADASVTAAQRRLADEIMATAGCNIWVEEERLIDAVIATSGSGPAYYFALMEAMIAGAMELGLDAAAARRLVLQTALGAARMATESGAEPGVLRAQVASPGGTTAAALAAFEAGDLDGLVKKAMQSAAARAAELADDLSGE